MSRDEFYVGYLPLPNGHRRFLRVAVPIALGFIVTIAALAAGVHRHPGPGSWTDDSREFTGVVVTTPYPMLVSDEGVYMIVAPGKRGADALTSPFAGHRVRLRGTVIARDARSIIELAESPTAIASIDAHPLPLAISPGDSVQVVGEVIDPKCYLGAMKPGDGRAHKACATLCIRGGIPPMLVSIDPSGAKKIYLLATAGGASAKDLVTPWIAETAAVSGRLARLEDLDIIFVDRLEAPGRETLK